MNPTNEFPKNHITPPDPMRSWLLSRVFLFLSFALAFAASTDPVHAVPANKLLSALENGAASESEAYDRHFVVLVDQTVFFQGGHEAMSSVYGGLKQWLKGKKELTYTGLDRSQSSLQSIEPFNEQHDQLSVFAFSLQGKGTGMGHGPGLMTQRSTDFAKINAMSRDGENSNDDVYKELVKSLITPYGDYHSSGLTFDRFCSEKMWPLFSGHSSTFSSIGGVGAITLSYYVYPLIFDRLEEKTPAKQIILVVVSDFESGSFNENASKDLESLWLLLSGKDARVNYMLQRVEKMKQPYTQVEMAHIVSQKLQGKTIVAKATALVVKQSVLHSPLFIASNLDLKQQGTSSRFTMCPSTVSFNKSDSIVVDRVEIVVTPQGKPDSVMCRFTVDSNSYGYDAEHHEYRFKELDISLPTTSPSDLLVTYNFYTHSTAGGESLLPVLYTAERTIAQRDIFLTNAKLQRIIIMVTIILIVLIFLIILLGLGLKKAVSLKVGHFNQKFTNVTSEHGAEELPCWFYGGPDDYKRSIRIDGRILLAHHFGLPVNSTVSIRLQNLQPGNGFTFYVNGSQLTEEWKKVEKTGNTFSIVLDIVADPQVIAPNKLTTVSANLDVCVDSSVLGLCHNQDIDRSHQLKFFFTRDLGTAWVGFDPGTTGSCVAYGNTGGTLDDPAIRLVTDTFGQAIIPSCLALHKNPGSKAIDDLQPGVDYKYGSDADANAGAYQKSKTPVFRSIKKLLGYQNDLHVRFGQTDHSYKGKELAHLLVKGLQRDLERDVVVLSQADRQRYVGQAEAQRAVVAIPNNYTLPKIIEMVDSVHRLPQFKEVRFVYEAEAVLFNYLSRNFAQQKPGTETVMVYDMGGATINLTVFRVHYEKRGGTIYYHIETLGRIGYSVGGDNIDVALMEYLLKMKSITGIGNKDQRHSFETQHKEQILRSILELKKDIIKDHNNGKASVTSKLCNGVTFENFMNGDMLPNTGSTCSMDASTYDSDAMRNEILQSQELQDFVYKNINDVVEEILKYPDVQSLGGIDTIIFSGRSTLFPLVKENVEKSLAKHYGQGHTPKEFKLDGQSVKTAVAYGACWYGIYNSLVTLDNSRLASAYGFKFTTNGRAGMEVLLQQNCRFGEDGCISATSRDLNDGFAADGNQVNFYQIMGSGQDSAIFSKANRHKVNYLCTIPATTMVKNVSMSVTRNNIVTCKACFNTGEQRSINNIEVQGRDITNENDWAYVFATSVQTANSNSATPQPSPRSSQQAHASKPAGTPKPAGTSKPASDSKSQPHPPVPKNIKRL